MSAPPVVRRTLTLSIFDGVFFSVMVGAAETYFSPYAIALGASNLTLGLLLALPVLVGSLAQLFSVRLLSVVGSRRRLMALFAGLQALAFLPMIAVGLSQAPARGGVFLAIVCGYFAFQLVAAPAWISLMGDLVPERERGAYFARRSRFLQLATFLSMLAAGPVLTWFRDRGETMHGFALVFVVSMASRLVSMGFLLAHHEPRCPTPLEEPPWQAVARVLREPSHRRLIRYLSTMNFSVYLSAPFFTAYMLRMPERHGLGWPYATFTLVTAISVGSKYVFLPLWGKAADRFGSRKCLALSAWLVCALPLIWLFPPEHASMFLAVIIASQVWSGFAWAGHELCSFNFVLDTARAEERGSVVAAMNAINGVMLFAGASVGALLAEAVPAGWNPFLVVFCLSSAARLATCVTLLPELKEVRVVEHISYRSLFFRIASLRPQLGAMLRLFALPTAEEKE